MVNSYHWDRPKLNIPKTKGEWVLDIIGYSLYFGSIALLIMMWGKLPEEIPWHYNEFGEVTRWGSKGKLLFLPFIGGFILLIMQTIERFPEVHNYPKRLNELNAKKFYLTSRKMINQVKNVCLLLFAFSLLVDISVAMQWSNRIGIVSLPLLMIGLGVPIVLGIVKFKKIT